MASRRLLHAELLADGLKALISAERLRTLLGFVVSSAGDLDALAHAISQRAPECIRWRSTRKEQEPNDLLRRVPWLNTGQWWFAEERPSRTLDYLAGQYYIQDAGSMLAIAACKAALPKGSVRVCDLCAAPGGKATALAEYVGQEGWLLANEPIQNRLPVLEFNLARTGTDRWGVSGVDPAVLADRVPGEFDLVLVDAPCSGQTLVGKQKQSEGAWSDQQVEHSAARQRRILDAAVKLLRPGGRIVYSTCTFATAENESQVEWLESTYGMERVRIESLTRYEVTDAQGCYRVWPHRDQSAGAFAAVLELPQLAVHQTPSMYRERRPTLRFKRLESVLPDWGSFHDGTLYQLHQRWIGWPNDIPLHWLEVISGGPEVAYQTGKSWHPGYALALRESPVWQTEREVELSSVEAWGLLRGQAIFAPANDWFVVRSGENRLCWGKSDGKRIRPAIPPALRAMIV